MQKVIINEHNKQQVYNLKIDDVLYADTNGNKLVVVHLSKKDFPFYSFNRRWLAIDSKTGLCVFDEKTKKELIESLSTYNKYRLRRYVEFLHTDKYQKILNQCEQYLDGVKQ